MAKPLELVLWVKSDCDACKRAEELMASLSAAMLFAWSTQEGEHGDSVPVVATSDGRVLAEAPIRGSDLVDAIVAASGSARPDCPD